MSLSCYLLTFDQKNTMDIPLLVAGEREDIMLLEGLLEQLTNVSLTLWRAEELDDEEFKYPMWEATREALAQARFRAVTYRTRPRRRPSSRARGKGDLG